MLFGLWTLCTLGRADMDAGKDGDFTAREIAAAQEAYEWLINEINQRGLFAKEGK